MKFTHIAVAFLLLGSTALPAGAQVKVIELGHEAEPKMIRMPDRDNGELSLQSCPTCKVLRLRASVQTVYAIGPQLVTLKDMTQYLALNPEASVVVMQEKGSASLLRVVVYPMPPSRK